MYYPGSENKGADQLRGYREADLRLCFHLCRLLVFQWGGSFVMNNRQGEKKTFKLELKYRVEKISKIKRVEDELFLLIFSTRSLTNL